MHAYKVLTLRTLEAVMRGEIGRASCRERV